MEPLTASRIEVSAVVIPKMKPLWLSLTRIRFEAKTAVLYRKDTGAALMVVPRRMVLDTHDEVRDDAHQALYDAYAQSYDEYFIRELNKIADKIDKERHA